MKKNTNHFFIQIPHWEIFVAVWMSVLKIVFLNLFLFMLLRSQSVEPPPVLKVCRSWGEMVTDDSDWPPEKMLYSSLIGKDWRVEQIQRDSQSESVDFPDCLSHYRLLTTSPWLSLAVSFSHIFQRLPWEKKGVGQYRQYCPLKSVPVPFHSPPLPLASERHFLSFPVLSALVKQLLTLFPPTVRWFQSAGE